MSLASSRLIAIPVFKVVETPHSSCDEEYDNCIDSSVTKVLPSMYLHADGCTVTDQSCLILYTINMRFHS